jgi:coenzyme F420-dependent glucose-6-phosphate dehydrogenase
MAAGEWESQLSKLLPRAGYFAAHEQYQPSVLLDRAVTAEKAGFQTIWCSDHFHPWVHSKASAGFAWVWLASVAERTSLPFGTAVTAPTFRYHPAVVAQAFATLAAMYPNRVILGLGSGEPINESPLGYEWPSSEVRLERFVESLQIIRLLWTRSFVDFSGKYYRLKGANLYTRPLKPPPIYVAVGGPRMSEIAGRYADGIIMAPVPGLEHDFYPKRIFGPLEKGASEFGRVGHRYEKVVILKASYDEDYDKALAASRFWATELMPFVAKQDVSDPRDIERQTEAVADEDIEKLFIISNRPEDHLQKLKEYARLGFTHLAIHSISPDEDSFFEVYRKDVLPYLISS